MIIFSEFVVISFMVIFTKFILDLCRIVDNVIKIHCDDLKINLRT